MRWEAYIDPDPVRWIQTHFYIPETNRPLELEPSQAVPLREALSRDENGLFNYSTVVWGSIKKSAKSTIAAAVCLWMMWQRPWSSAKIIGNDLKQADSRVAFYLRRAIALHPHWNEIVKVINYKVTLPNHSKIEAIPIDPEGEAGGNDDFVSYTEIWAWKSKAAQRLWSESTLSPTKYGKSLRWLDTYAGFSGESIVLERLYDQGVTNGHVLDEELEMYANGRLFALWNTRPRLSYQTQEYYNQERSTLTPEEFDRLHRNQWQSSLASFVPMEWWTSCQSEYPPPDRNAPMTIALDAAVSGDCFAIVMIGGMPGADGEYCVRYSQKWTPPQGQKLRFSNNEGTGAEDEIRRLVELYNVIEISYDPYQLEDMAGRFMNENMAHVFAFNQNAPRLIADKRLFDMIRDRRVHHSGDSDLTEHVQNANRKEEGDNKMRIVKRSELLKIDLTVAMSMALDRAVFWQL